MRRRGCQVEFSAMATLTASQFSETDLTSLSTAIRPLISAGEMPRVRGLATLQKKQWEHHNIFPSIFFRKAPINSFLVWLEESRVSLKFFCSSSFTLVDMLLYA